MIGDLTVRFPWHTPSLSTAEDAAEADAEAGEIDNQNVSPSRHSVSSGSWWWLLNFTCVSFVQ